MADKLWGIVVLALGACQLAPVKPVPTVATIAATSPSYTVHNTYAGIAGQLEAVAELRRAIDGAAEMGRALERTRTPYTAWLHDGTMSLVRCDLRRRQRDLRASESRLVRASLTADVGPAFQRLNRQSLKE